jgi:4a-hydroxytetrahydrobiopterin dehydratase
MKRYPVEQAELGKALQTLPGWQVQNGKLHKEYRFATFSLAMGWMMSASVEADKMDHHPEWGNVYNRVTVDLVTHSLGNRISNLDIELAKKMEALADGRKP